MRTLWIVLSCLALTACSSTPEAPKDPPPKPFDAETIPKVGKVLMERFGFSEQDRAEVAKGLDELLADEKVKGFVELQQVNGIGVYEAASGGLIIKGHVAKGLVRLGVDQPIRKFSTEGVTVGIAAGGKISRGVFLVINLRTPAEFNIDYGFNIVAGTAAAADGRASAGVAKAFEGDHELRFVSRGFGFSGDLSKGSFTMHAEGLPKAYRPKRTN